MEILVDAIEVLDQSLSVQVLTELDKSALALVGGGCGETIVG